MHFIKMLRRIGSDAGYFPCDCAFVAKSHDIRPTVNHFFHHFQNICHLFVLSLSIQLYTALFFLLFHLKLARRHSQWICKEKSVWDWAECFGLRDNTGKNGTCRIFWFALSSPSHGRLLLGRWLLIQRKCSGRTQDENDLSIQIALLPCSMRFWSLKHWLTLWLRIWSDFFLHFHLSAFGVQFEWIGFNLMRSVWWNWSRLASNAAAV